MGRKKKKYHKIDLEPKPEKPIEKKESKPKIEKCKHKINLDELCPDCEVDKIIEIDTRMQKMLEENDFELAVYQSIRKSK